MDEQMLRKAFATIYILEAVDEYALAWDITVDEAIEVLKKLRDVYNKDLRKVEDSDHTDSIDLAYDSIAEGLANRGRKVEN
jgi:hypothetical protein